jgi:hypothetical protein
MGKSEVDHYAQRAQKFHWKLEKRYLDWMVYSCAATGAGGAEPKRPKKSNALLRLLPL